MLQSLTPQGIRLLSREVTDMRKNPTEGIRIDNDTEEDLSRLAGWVAGPRESQLSFEPHVERVVTTCSSLICDHGQSHRM